MNTAIQFAWGAALYFFIGGPLIFWLFFGMPLELDFSSPRLLGSMTCGVVVVLLAQRRKDA